MREQFCLQYRFVTMTHWHGQLSEGRVCHLALILPRGKLRSSEAGLAGKKPFLSPEPAFLAACCLVQASPSLPGVSFDLPTPVRAQGAVGFSSLAGLLDLSLGPSPP